jgi:DNA-directed RNA polymerase specialized sigma subunit
MIDGALSLLDDFLELTKEAMASKKQEKKPIDRAVLKDTQRKEHVLWHAWNDNGRKPEHLKPIMDSIKPILKTEANKWRGVEIPTSTINAEIRKHALNAIKNYNPDRNVLLGTWVTGNLKKTGRFIKQYQNLGRIPEAQIGRIRTFKQSKSDLTTQLGYEPDTKALADHLGWPQKRVKQLEKELSREDKPVSGWLSDPADIMTPKELEAIHILQYDTRMSGEERSVYEFTFGINGKPKLAPGEIAKRTSLHPSKVSRIRNRIKGYVQEAMEVL